MLASRYVHLHEALGLGAMWLPQHAQLISQETDCSHFSKEKKSALARSSSSEHSSENDARMALMQQIRQKNQNSTAIQSTQNPPTPHTPSIRTSSDFDINELRQRITPKTVMAITMCASPSDVAAKRLLSGEDGVLFEKMLAAIGLSLADVHLTCWFKGLPDFNLKPATEQMMASTPRIQAECQFSQAKTLLLLGDFFERADVVAQIQSLSVPYFTIPHPRRILDNPHTLRRPAWEVLQKLQKYLNIVNSI